MAARSKNHSAPLTFDLPLGLVSKLRACRKPHGLKTVSGVVRLAIERFDFDDCKPNHVPHCQISVRITSRQRSTLKRYAKRKDTSVGELLRLALDDLPVKPARGARRA